MSRKISSWLIGTKEKKQLLHNISALGVLQGLNYLLPLLTVPYLVRVLGVEYFGLLAFATTTIAYFNLITDYGFNLSATRQISIHRNDKEKVNIIFSSVMILKTSFLIISFLLMSLLITFVEFFKNDMAVYLATFGVVIGQAIFPVWIFQGMEKMKYILYLNVVAKVFFTACIFIFVKNQKDYLIVPIATSIGSIIIAVASLFIVKYQLAVSFSVQSWKSLRIQLIEGWNVFISTLAISLYTISTIFILGIFTSNSTVGQFSAADKIIQAVKGLYQPISQAIYPLIGKKINENKDQGIKFIRKVVRLVGLSTLFISSLVYLFSESLVNILFGEEYSQSILILKIMALLPFIVSLSNIFGIQAMLNLGYKDAFSRILILAAALGVALTLIMVHLYQDIGAALTLVFIELFVTISMYLYLRLWKKIKC